MGRHEAGRREIDVQREQPSIHERGGLGREGWQLVLDGSRQPAQARALPQLIPGHLFAYAQGVIAGRIPDTMFGHRAHLDRHDWQEVAKLFEGDTPKRNLADVAKNRLKISLATDIKHYAQFEAARAYSIRDHALDQLRRASFTWKDGKWKKDVEVQGDVVGYYDPNFNFPFYDSTFETRDLDGTDYEKLNQIFLLPRGVHATPTNTPLELYDLLRERTLQEPHEVRAMVRDALKGFKGLRNPDVIIDLPTRVKAKKVEPTVVADSTVHFGSPPLSHQQRGLVSLSYKPSTIELPDGPLVMQAL